MTIAVDEDTDCEPDAVVNCGAPLADAAIAVTSPVIVREVLSPSTQSIDLADKLADYFKAATLQQQLIAVPASTRSSPRDAPVRRSLAA